MSQRDDNKTMVTVIVMLLGVFRSFGRTCTISREGVNTMATMTMVGGILSALLLGYLLFALLSPEKLS